MELSNSTHTVFDFNPRDAFHIYAMEWNASLLTWWVDGAVVKQQASSPFFDRGWPMDIALSFGLRPPLNRDHGGHPNATGFPTTYYVDWVRVWQRSSQ
jgi:beta-glucanase (GH16 family)|eukprot:COSAG01_NODE_2454_length_7673_cov_68.907314_5_plen_98_part_00